MHALIFFDSRARANFIMLELATHLDIKTKDMGGMNEASLATWYSMAITPIIGKFCIYIIDFVDYEYFYTMPLQGCNILLGMPWFHTIHTNLDTLSHKGENIKGQPVPIASLQPFLM